ncbi:MAG: hypothetical protein ACI4DU_08710 [Lachnospiraceae bacterium]
MKKFRRVFSIGLFCLLLTISVSGCGTGEKDRETGTEIIDFSSLSNDADNIATQQEPDMGIQNESAAEPDNLPEESNGEMPVNPSEQSPEGSSENSETNSVDSTDEESTTASGNQVMTEEETFCYESTFGYEIHLPLSWEETVQIVETEEGTAFIFTAAEEENYTGILFLIRPLALDALEDYEGIAYAEDYAVQIGDGYQILRPVEECYDKDNAYVAENFEEKYNEIADIIMTMQAIR